MEQRWQFRNRDGEFTLANPQSTNHLYFPLVNEAGMMSVITPGLHGDIKAGQHKFLMPPISVFDIHNTRSGRNFWLSLPGNVVWSVTGNASPQIAKQFIQHDDEVSLTAGILWHKMTRENKKLGIRAEICNFVPASQDRVELMIVQITNISKKPIHFTPTAAIPIYGRSADNLRDHRHVTSLLNRISCTQYGVVVKPTLTFDERGHQENDTLYVVIGIEEDSKAPLGFFPIIDDYIGEGGNLSWPEAVVRPSLCTATQPGAIAEGYEALGGIRFVDSTLAPGETSNYMLVLGILKSDCDVNQLIRTYGGMEKFDDWLNRTKEFWLRRQKNFAIITSNHKFDQWVKWVSVQPTLRRMFGNSFMPYHDYGRGGRGWRDLWQDILALMITEGGAVDEILFGNFAGIRFDGSNATIIGDQPGDFRADRNNIPRVWMDHGAWPFLTTHYYIDQTGDLGFLLRSQAYFKDGFINRAQGLDKKWDPSQGTKQRSQNGDIYEGSILEHLLIQHLTAFFNVGEHNIIRLEDADWNDGLDMAQERGESVAFSALYAGNLNLLSKLVEQLKTLGIQKVEFAIELRSLFDTLYNKIDYDSPSQKRHLLKEYFALVSHSVSGKKFSVQIDDLKSDLDRKASWLVLHIRDNEWLHNREGYGWFNGYYDNDGQRLEGDHPYGVRMTLTGQVFSLLCGIASDEQAMKMIQSVDHYLFDFAVGGPRLNTDFKEVLLNMGRCFGFAFGHKENGAMFSHMAVMYAYALYERGFAKQAHQVLMNIWRQSINFKTSRMYPGIPEYFDHRGRGVYPYLTGSASWYLFSLLTQAFGIRGILGDLQIEPKLLLSQFDRHRKTSIQTRFADRDLLITFVNINMKDFGYYKIKRVFLNGEEISEKNYPQGCVIPRKILGSLASEKNHQIEIILD